MTVYERELRKLFENSDLMDHPRFSGRVCIGELGKDLRVRAEFLSTCVANQYDAIRLTVLNRTEGVVDRTMLRFKDVWGKKPVPGNPNFRSGVLAHLWDDRGDVDCMPIIPRLRITMPSGSPSGNICPCSGNGRRNGNRPAPSWCLSACRCGAMWKPILNSRDRRHGRCLRMEISPFAHTCCSHP